MQTFFSILILVITFTSCKCQKSITDNENLTPKETMKQSQEMITIEYEETSRGYFNKIVISNGEVQVIEARDAKPKQGLIATEDKVQLEDLLLNIDKINLKLLKDPTQKRFYDGAPIAKFRLVENEEIYETKDFDGGYPPKEIEQIVNKILEIAAKVK